VSFASNRRSIGGALAAASLLVLMLLGCGGSSAKPSLPGARPSADGGVPAWKRRCEEYAGAPVDVSYQDGSGGAAVLYRTKGNVQALRERTNEVARFHSSTRRRTPAMHDLNHVPHYAYVEELPEGAKLVLVPKSANPQQLEELRRNVQQEITNMQKHGCGGGQEAL
jgi:hypothetical protein